MIGFDFGDGEEFKTCTPQGASELKARLDGFLSLPEGWDSYAGKRISERAISKAKEFVDLLPGDGWQAVPTPDGGVQLERHKDGFDVEVSIEAV